MAALASRGVVVAEITLHVGYGTFQPVRVERVEDHRLEPERYDVSPMAAAQINRALDEGRRVVAVGTTTTRALEAVARANGGRLAAETGADRPVHPSRVRLSGRRGVADELPPAAILAAHAGGGLRRPRARAGGLCRGGRGELSVLQLRRCDACSLKLSLSAIGYRLSAIGYRLSAISSQPRADS